MDSKMREKKKLPTVPATLIKRRERVAAARLRKANAFAAKLEQKSVKKYQYFKRAEKYVKEYRQLEEDELKAEREARKNHSVRVPAESKLALVIRIRGVNQVPPKAKKVMKLFRLFQINSAVFVRLTKATLNMLRLCEPYVTWGYPSLKTIRSLIYKRGRAIVNKQRIPITSNEIIEKELGDCGIICVEDLIHEIYTVGKNFPRAARFLSPFVLTNPLKGWRKKTNHYVEGGDFGNRERKINVILKTMI